MWFILEADDKEISSFNISIDCITRWSCRHHLRWPTDFFFLIHDVHTDTVKKRNPISWVSFGCWKSCWCLEIVKSYFAKQIFDWDKKRHTLCTDGSPIMIGNASGFATLVKKKNKNLMSLSLTPLYRNRHWQQRLCQ